MSSQSDKKPKWKEATPAQRVGHRAILRFKELADEFARDLNEILRAEKSKEEVPELGVYFVSSDRNPDLLPESNSNQDRHWFYNLRLLETFRLTDSDPKQTPIKPALDWIKQNVDVFESLFRCSDFLENHQHDHYARFRRQVEALKAAEEKGEGEVRRIAEQVHDLLVEAISAMPYTGLLPSALDQAFHEANYLDFSVPVQFELKFNDGKVLFPDFKIKKVTLQKEPDSLISPKAFKDNGQNQEEREKQAKDLGKLYIDQFINWFTLGFDPVAETSKENSPYQSTGKSKDIQGLALPAFHFHDHAGSPVGGFEGWAVIFCNASPTGKALSEELKSVLSKLVAAQAAFHLACRSFSRRIREERMRELVEKEWGSTTSGPHAFTLEHFREFDGWIGEDRKIWKLPDIEKHWIFAFLQLIDGKFEVYDERDEDDLLDGHPSSPAPPPSDFSISKITHIAILPPSHKMDETWKDAFLFRKRDDTLLPKKHDDLVDYGFHITQSVHQIYEAARIKELQLRHERLMGRQAEMIYQFQAASHELKDLTGAIPKADGKPKMLKILKECFLNYSLPVTGLRYDKHKSDISPFMFGLTNNLVESSGDQDPFANLDQWIKELVLVATGVQAMATACTKKVPESDDEIDVWRSQLYSYFSFDDSLQEYSVPSHKEANCFYSAAILCVVRNMIKHSFNFGLKPPERDFYWWKYRWNDSKLVISCDPEWLQFSNQCKEGDERPGPNGTSGAIEFYLRKFFKEISMTPSDPMFIYEQNDGRFICKLPMVESTSNEV